MSGGVELKAPLTVEQARERLARMRSDCLIGIPYDPGFSTAGGSPFMGVHSISAGFDWDNGKVFLHPIGSLGAAGAAFNKQRKRTDETVAALYLIERTLKDKRTDAAFKLAEVGHVIADLRKSVERK